MSDTPYRGRFAPTPSGPLHFGSLLAALASFLDARQQGGTWMLRMEDLDQPRVQPGAADSILRTLEHYNLYWDGDIRWQSQHLPHYQGILQGLLDCGLAFVCDCSRSQLSTTNGIYDGHCRDRKLGNTADRAVRLRVDNAETGFTDRLQGPFSQHLEADVGDFVIRRRDGIIAYQLAVVADDIQQQINQVVRGADLLDSTPRQLWLYQKLDARPPHYLHIPLAMRSDGNKLSKRLGSPPLSDKGAAQTLFLALQVLQQAPPAEAQGTPVSELLEWAVRHWNPHRLPACKQLPADILPTHLA